MIIQKLSTCSKTRGKNIIHTEREVLDAQLERMYNEEFGDTNGTLEEGMSVEYRKAEVIMDQSVTLVNGHYQIQLPAVTSNSQNGF